MSAGDEVKEPVAEKGPRKRKLGKKKKGGMGKKLKALPGSAQKVKITTRMKKLFQKRARDYNSDEDEDDNVEESLVEDGKNFSATNMEVESVDSSDDENKGGNDDGSDNEDSDGEGNGEIQPGITKFAEGCKGFKIAFRAITKKSKEDDALGPVLSAHKQLVVKKLAEEEAERKVKGEAKREKHAVAEKGHVKCANYLDSHERFLIGIATKGVVKLFNAVNKAQHAQKGLNPSRSKDAKVIKKRRKDAFFSEIGKTQKAETATKAGNKSSGSHGDEVPAWAPLCDNYMLTIPKLKDWDRNQNTNVADDFEKMSRESSSEED